MDTYFATSKKANPEELEKEINLISSNQLIDALLTTACGLFAVLNDKRQLIAINRAFLKALDVKEVDSLVGYRLGEVIKCEFAHAYPNGCGTTIACTTCGAAIAMASTLNNKESFESNCIIKSKDNGVVTDLMFNVKTRYVEIEQYKFVLVFLRDITREQELSVIERVFFHDINNILTSLNVAVDLATHEESQQEMLGIIKNSCYRLRKEIEMQQCLSKSMQGTYQLQLSEINVRKLLEQVNNIISLHNSCGGKLFVIEDNHTQDINIISDLAIVMRVLTNMAINALEATDYGEKVKLWYSINSDTTVTFNIHNLATIPEEDVQRVFQRNFSTKGSLGRGLGTYSMKLFGEKILGGKIEFTTSENDGTTFSFTIAQKQKTDETE